jgi:signal transduction histidine kinase
VQIVPNVGALAGFFVIAFVSWLSARSLNHALEDLRAINRELDQRVADRTRELEEAQDQLVRKEKLATLGQLAGGVGHELRNPLGAIKNATYFLNMVMDEPEPEVQETLDILTREVSASEKIISSLLDYARVRPPVRRRVDINDLVQETLSRIPMPENVDVVLQLDESLPYVLADPDQLVQVFSNVITNGCQAMPEGGELVVDSAALDSRWVVVSVTDAGTGIPEENRAKLFEPLFTTKAKGIGLGLPIVKALVEGHGGVIEVESEVGKGTTFAMRLPRPEGASLTEQEG